MGGIRESADSVANESISCRDSTSTSQITAATCAAPMGGRLVFLAFITGLHFLFAVPQIASVCPPTCGRIAILPALGDPGAEVLVISNCRSGWISLKGPHRWDGGPLERS